MNDNAHRPTTAESKKLSELLAQFRGPTRRAISRSLAYAQLLTHMRSRFGLGSLWALSDQSALQEILGNYNRLDRALAGVERDKYLCALDRDDLTILAPVGMEPEQYLEDQVQLSAWFLPVIVGVVIVAGAIAVSKILEYKANTANLELKNRVLNLDEQFAKSPDPSVRNDWKSYKAANKDLFRATEDQPLLDKLFGSGWQTVAIVGVVAVLAIKLLGFLGNRKEAKSV